MPANAQWQRLNALDQLKNRHWIDGCTEIPQEMRARSRHKGCGVPFLDHLSQITPW
jgi:hypothetical protein